MSRPLAARLRTIVDGPVGAVLGGSVYGAWATFANLVLGLHAALRIGFTHFLMCFGLTWGSVNVMRKLFSLASTPRGGFWMAFTGTLTITYTLLVSVHLLIGTPNILLTLTPGFLPTIGFSLFYATLLRRTMPLPASAVPAGA